MRKTGILLLCLLLACGMLLTACGEGKEGSKGTETSGAESSGAGTSAPAESGTGSSIPDTFLPEPYTEGLEYTLNEDGKSYTVTGIGTAADTDVVIPAKYEGKPVTAIGDEAFNMCQRMTSIVIPGSVQVIGRKAFSACTGLSDVVIPEGVVTIGNSAFSYSGLKSVVIPDSVRSIGSTVFVDCASLRIVTIGKGVTSIGKGAFHFCRNLSEVHYGGSAEDWAKIEIESDNDDLTSAAITCGA